MLAIDGLAHRPIAVARLADVGQLAHQLGHRRAEFRLDVAEGRRGVFHRIVQPGGGDHLRVVHHRGDQLGHRLQVHGIGLLVVLAPVIDPPMGIGGVVAGAGDQIRIHVPIMV